MDGKKIKDGLSVKEIEAFTKKHRFEVFFGLMILLSALFSFVFFTGLSAPLAAIGGILGVAFPLKIEAIFKKASSFFGKQEDTTQLILGIGGLVLSVFLPGLIFLILGCCGGRSFLQFMEADSFKQE